jgi:pilus assembly protein CpaB
MMRKPGNVFVLAVVLGALSAALVHRQLRAQQRELDAVRRSRDERSVELVVAATRIPIGTRIEADQVRRVPWPADLRPEEAVLALDVAVGSVARATIEKNQPLVQSQLVRDAAGLLPLMIDEGMRGVSVKVDEVTGVSGFITPNSRVDVLAAGSVEGDDAESERSKLILQNVKVLAVGKSVEQRNDQPVEVPTVTLLVSPEDAEKLTLATRHDPVRLALRNFRDDGVVRTAGATAATLFTGERPAPLAAAAVADDAAAGGYSVEVLLGEESTRQTVF